jgi:predicted lysophospholipase L1 biosynthesis ABC-type transport system permease subunit
MNTPQQSLEDLQHIKKMMERSSRFISLSGLSGIAAGICALVGAWFASQ